MQLYIKIVIPDNIERLHCLNLSTLPDNIRAAVAQNIIIGGKEKEKIQVYYIAGTCQNISPRTFNIIER